MRLRQQTRLTEALGPPPVNVANNMVKALAETWRAENMPK
jgi:hypothetical protein